MRIRRHGAGPLQRRAARGVALRVEPSLLPEEFADAARNLDATTDARFARIGLTPDVIALIRRRLATWPRDPLKCLALQGASPGHTPVRVPSGCVKAPKVSLAAAHQRGPGSSIGAFHVRDPDADASGWNS